MSKTLLKYNFPGEFNQVRNKVHALSKRARILSKLIEVNEASSKESKQIDEAVINISFDIENLSPEELNGLLISDPIYHYLLVRQQGVWKKVKLE